MIVGVIIEGSTEDLLVTERPHLKLLGIPELTDGNGQRIKLRTRKQLGLLVYLTLEARIEPVTRDKLADLFWRDRDTKRLHSLSQALTEIRKKLGSNPFTTDRLCVRLQIDITTDLDLRNIESLPSQVPTPFEGLEMCAGPRYAQWIEAKRDHTLSEIQSRLSERLFEARANGRVEAVRERAEQLYSVDPYNEAAVQALVGRRISSGDLAGALRLFRKHMNASKTDLGRPPSVETLASLRRFERRLWHDPDVDDSGTTEPSTVDPRPKAFVGRESQMVRLEELSREVKSGRFRSCVLRGPDGFGKTTVLRNTFAAVAMDTFPAYMVNCEQMGQRIPFAAVSDLLEQLSHDPSLGATDAIWLAEASRVAPGIKASYPGIPDPLNTPPETVRVRLGEAIKNMLEAIADGSPFLLAFDDMHYMDPASRDVVHMLARRLEDVPAFLLAAVRCSETDLGLGGGEGVDGVDWQETIDLHALDDSETAALISALTQSDDPVEDGVVRKILALAEGNPLLTELLVSDWRNSGHSSLVMVNIRGGRDTEGWSPSDTMRSAFARQYQGLPTCADRLVHLLATAGRSMPLENICRLLAVPSETVGAAVFALIERGIVALDGNALGFRNDLHRAFVYSTLPEETRRYQHAHLAQHLRVAKDQSEFQYALEASHHFLKAGWIDEAKELACVGADRAITWGAPKEAEKALEAVIGRCPGSPNVQAGILLAKAYSAQGSFDKSLKTLRRIRLGQASKEHQAIAAHLRAEALHKGRLAEDNHTIAAATKRAIGAANEIGDERLVMKAQQVAAEIAFENGGWSLLDRIEDQCATLEKTTQDIEARGLANLTIGYCHLVSSKPAVAARHFSRSAQLFRSLSQDSKLHTALNGLAMSAASIGEFDKALAGFKEAAAAAARSGDTVAHANALLNLASLSNELGHFSQAADFFWSAIQLDAEISTSRVSAAIYCNAANLSIAIGNFDEAAALLHTATGSADRSQLWQHFVSIRLTEADLHLAKGEPDNAWPLVKQALSHTGDRHRLVPDVGQYWRLRRHYYSVTGDGEAMTAGNPTLIALAHVLELQAFEEWCTREDVAQRKRTPAVTELVRLGLFGVLARLAAVGVRSQLFQSAAAEASGAQVVIECFPDEQWEGIPSAVLNGE